MRNVRPNRLCSNQGLAGGLHRMTPYLAMLVAAVSLVIG